jgi:hypothetical protein
MSEHENDYIPDSNYSFFDLLYYFEQKHVHRLYDPPYSLKIKLNSEMLLIKFSEST